MSWGSINGEIDKYNYGRSLSVVSIRAGFKALGESFFGGLVRLGVSNQKSIYEIPTALGLSNSVLLDQGNPLR